MAPLSKNKISAKQPIEPVGQFSRTKIIATLGPATDGYTMVEKLISSGVDGLRLNLSHGALDEHSARVNDIRRASSKLGRPVAIIADLQGPKLRVASDKLTTWLKRYQAIKTGDIVVIASGQHPGIIGGTDTIKVRVTP